MNLGCLGGHRLCSCCTIDAPRDERRFFWLIRGGVKKKKVNFPQASSSPPPFPLLPPPSCTRCSSPCWGFFAALFRKPVLSYFHCSPMTPESHSSSSPFHPTAAALLHLPLFWPTFKGLLLRSKTGHFLNRIIHASVSFFSFLFFTPNHVMFKYTQKPCNMDDMKKISLCTLLCLWL